MSLEQKKPRKELPCGCMEKPENRGEICPKHRQPAESAVTTQKRDRLG